MRRLALFLLVLLPAAVHAQAQPHFSIQAITYGQPGQVVVVPEAINNRGQVTGLLAGYTTRPGSFIWPGSTAPFGPPASNPYSGGSATDINDSGIVVGGPPAF